MDVTWNSHHLSCAVRFEPFPLFGAGNLSASIELRAKSRIHLSHDIHNVHNSEASYL